MRLDQILHEVSDLRKQVEELRARVQTLGMDSSSEKSLISRRLKGRGLKIYRQEPREKLLIPSDLPPALTTQFYERMKKYSLRLFLRDLLKVRHPFCPHDLTHYCSDRVAEEYTRFLGATSTVVLLRGNQFRLNLPGISSFGPTLEWFVAQMFQREFVCPATFGVRFKETDVGGDYDVLALWEGRLLYAEVKSSPPKSIEEPEIRAFFLRIHDLIPDVSFFFNDTHLRMKDKVIEMFEREIRRAPNNTCTRLSGAAEKISDEIYHVDHRIYVLNSKRDIVNNFRICLRDHLRESGNIDSPRIL